MLMRGRDNGNAAATDTPAERKPSPGKGQPPQRSGNRPAENPNGERRADGAVKRRPAQPPQGQGQAQGQRPPASARPDAEVKEQPTKLRQLDFIDLYVPLEGQGPARYNPKNVRIGQPGNRSIPASMAEDVSQLTETLRKIPKEDFSVVHDSIRYRGARQKLANGEAWVCLRKISSKVPTLEDLKIRPQLIPHLRGLGVRNGLVIVCGGTGQGKSTTANALLADFLNRLGHVAMTIEDPVEFALNGERGSGGYCFQVEVEDDSSWAPALKRALRWHPRYLLVGEIRSGAAAAQVLRAATSGHLVITTLHAAAVEQAIQALIQVAENEIGGRAQELVAEGLMAVFHQTLTHEGPQLSFLFTDKNSSDPVRQCIRSGKLNMLNSYIEQQEIRIFGEQQ